MDTRYKFKEVRNFLKNLHKDYKSSTHPNKKQKRQAYWRTLRLLMMYLWNGISAPIIYPIWFLFKKTITNKLYKDTTWQEIVQMIDDNKTEEVKTKLKKNGGPILYWLWTYGDLRDPLGLGEIMTYGVKNSFWNRYKENAFRNARFTINFMEFRTGTTVEYVPALDTRNFKYMHKSWGIGDNPDGIYFLWMKDESGKWYFIYEDNNKENIFYYGYVGLLNWGRKNGRFEISYRKTDSSYTI